MTLQETFQPSQPVELIYTKYGWMFCPPGDQYVTGSLKRWGVYSETEAMLLQQLCRNKRVLMAGGHIGSIAVPIAQVASEVTVYEPQPLLATLCRANAASCGVGHKMFVENAAFGPEAGHINVPVLRLDSQYNMGKLGKDDWGKGARVRMDSLPTLLNSGIDFLLLDVEGMELELLKAAGPNLPCVMWVECDRPDSGRDIIEWLQQNDYRAYWMINPLTPNDVHPNEGPWPMQASFNLLCLYKDEPFPLPNIPQYLASVDDPIGNCTFDKMIWGLTYSE